MQIHRVRGRDLRDALERARRSFGADALVLAQEEEAGGVTVSVTARVAREREEPGARDVARRLEEAGASPDLTAAVLDVLRERGAQGAFAIDAAAEALAARLRAAATPASTERVRAIAFVGPTGSGKSTAVAKLALRLARAKRRVVAATLDGHRAGSSELLRAACERARVPFRVARFREDLPALLDEARGAEVLLVDSAGRSPRDREHLEQLEDVLGQDFAGADLSVYLTVAATAGREVLEEVRAGFARTRPTALVATKLDETRRTAPALELAALPELPAAFLCTGQELERDFYRATPDRMADLVLGGRVR